MNQLYLENVTSAKESLKIWLSNLAQKNNGNQMFMQENEIDKSKTGFALWYYGEGQTFSSFETFRNIEAYYNNMYDLFLSYNSLYAKPVKKSFFSNKFEKHKQALDGLFKKIEISCYELLEQVNLFQNTLIESPLFMDVGQAQNLVESDDVISIPTFDENQQTIQVDEPIHEDENETLFELEKELAIEEQIPQTDENHNLDESITTNLLKESDLKETTPESEQIIEKNAILDISNQETEKKHETEKFKIFNEIDIEEEIRRILN